MEAEGSVVRVPPQAHRLEYLVPVGEELEVGLLEEMCHWERA